eukprot:s4099_g3.t1
MINIQTVSFQSQFPFLLPFECTLCLHPTGHHQLLGFWTLHLVEKAIIATRAVRYDYSISSDDGCPSVPLASSRRALKSPDFAHPIDRYVPSYARDPGGGTAYGHGWN